MNRSAKVAAIIPCFNHGEVIDQAVKSVLGQSYQKLEVIIIDDGSVPETKQRLRELNLPRTRVIFREQNGGPSAARNTGIECCNADYILVLDADDAIRSDYVEKAVSILDKNPDVGIVSAGVQFRGERHSEWRPRGGGLTEILIDSIPPTSVFRRVCWREVGGYDEQIRGVEDWDLWIGITKRNWRVEVIDEILIDFTYSDDGVHHRHVVTNNQVLGTVIRKHRDVFSEHFEEILLAQKLKSFETVNLERHSYKVQRTLERLLTESRTELDQLRERLAEKNQMLATAKALHLRTTRSISYRLGMNLTWLLRMILKIGHQFSFDGLRRKQ